jgi:hypothetical protein
MSSPNVELQSKVLKFDQLLQSVEQFIASIRQRTDEALSDENLSRLVNEVFSNEEFYNRFIAAIIARIGQNSITNAVARESREEINQKVETIVSNCLTNDALLPLINRLIQMHASGQEVSIPDVQEALPRPEDIPLDSTENITLLCRILAGDNAIL